MSRAEDAETAETEALLSELSDSEKVALLSGTGMWTSSEIPRLGLGPLVVSDGPHGCRGLSWRGWDDMILSPCETALAATFDEAVIEEVASLLGQQAASRGVNVLLAPTLNLHRLPISGRHFECFSEDAHLSARAGVAYIRGVQQHVAACAKHFVGNDQEAARGTMNSIIDERTLHEMYLAPFEAAVKEAGVEFIMNGYNRFNGKHCSQSHFLLKELLRDQWGFKGVVVSDWWSTHSSTECLSAGLNLEMPGIEPRVYGGYLLDAVKAGTVSRQLLDERCRPVLRFLRRCSKQSKRPEEPSAPLRQTVLKRAAVSSVVLLKNEGSVLPLVTDGLQRVAIIGPNAAQTTLQGGGSSRVHPRRCETILEALDAQLRARGVDVVHAAGCLQEFVPGYLVTDEVDAIMKAGSCDAWGQPSPRSAVDCNILDTVFATGAFFSKKEWFRRYTMPILRRLGLRLSTPEEAVAKAEKEMKLSQKSKESTFASDFTKTCAFSLLGAAALALARARLGSLTWLLGTLCASLPVVTCYNWRGGGPENRRRACEDQMIAQAEGVAREADAVVLCVGTHGWWEVESLDQLHMKLPGRQDELIERTLRVAKKAVVVLNVGSPKELPWLEKASAIVLSYFGGQETAPAIAAVLLGESNPSGRLPSTWPKRCEDSPAMTASSSVSKDQLSPGDTPYAEGLHLGYRGYGEGGPSRSMPLFPFGHGLSYTKFERSADLCFSADCAVQVTVDVRNVGDRLGADVVQVYVKAGDSPQALRAFKRTTELEPGASETLKFVLTGRGLSTPFDVKSNTWSVWPSGTEIEVQVGKSSADIFCRKSFTV